ncbi:MAG: aminotransferase class I/II-fold pyridoxal phosphate-dependent enzyme [Candidatus Veblenbacteria bacterium]|nr:aminotransferase class I/II-fold pyridoxal phosphate-dependent enzyme [Candidatus Veblenbacteria bacterium]
MRVVINPEIARLEESATLRVNTEAKRLQAAGINVINLTAGELDFSTPSYIRTAVAKHLSENQYTPTLGLLKLRQRIARAASHTYGRVFTSGQVGVTAGSKSGLVEMLRIVVRRGDEVIIPVPAWVSYEHMVRLAGAKPVFVPLNSRYDLDVEAIGRAIHPRTRAIIINSPHNPTGAVFSTTRLRQLARRLKRTNVRVIADDVYRSLTFGWVRLPSSVKLFGTSTVVVNGFSKSQALTGWRIGYVLAQPELIAALDKLQGHTSGNTSLPAQYAALAALARGEPTQAFCTELAARLNLVLKGLAGLPEVSWVQPRGAFYLFLNIAKCDKDDERFCRRLIQAERVMLVPGSAFRSPGCVRLSLAASRIQLSLGTKRLVRFIRSYRV